MLNGEFAKFLFCEIDQFYRITQNADNSINRSVDFIVMNVDYF